nr:hypothetical protein [Streptomyces lydicus]
MDMLHLRYFVAVAEGRPIARFRMVQDLLVTPRRPTRSSRPDA